MYNEIKVSIFTPTHDTKFLQEVYDSIKEQSFHEWVIVYNNGAVPINFNDSRVKEIHVPMAPEWVGPLKAHACEQSTGDILLELDHDDLLAPDCLEEVKKAFIDPKIGFAYSNTVHCMGDWSKTRRFDACYGWEYREVIANGHELDEHISFDPTPNCISRIWFAPNHVRAFRKSVYDKIGGYNKGMRILDDLDLMCRMYQECEFYHIDKPLYVYRVHGENTWLKYNDEIQQNVYRVHDQYIESLSKRWAEINGLRKLDLGGRIGSPGGYETVDRKDADVNCNLDHRWPFKDNSVGVVRAFDVFEHLKDPINTMKELYRILAPGGYALIQVPSTDGRGAFQDPTHVSYWNQNSFLYYTDKNWAQYIDTPVRFQSMRCYTTEKDANGVCWSIAHLVKPNGKRAPGLMLI
jgi:SAM-dependent methyltransferase